MTKRFKKPVVDVDLKSRKVANKQFNVKSIVKAKPVAIIEPVATGSFIQALNEFNSFMDSILEGMKPRNK